MLPENFSSFSIFTVTPLVMTSVSSNSSRFRSLVMTSSFSSTRSLRSLGPFSKTLQRFHKSSTRGSSFPTIRSIVSARSQRFKPLVNRQVSALSDRSRLCLSLKNFQ
ncbi:hypothetical protein Mapa_003142 [Marchantia paleacea]|nr:hypothetical protein Mapa_003142 [Marchantia paleacea]